MDQYLEEVIVVAVSVDQTFDVSKNVVILLFQLHVPVIGAYHATIRLAWLFLSINLVLAWLIGISTTSTLYAMFST